MPRKGEGSILLGNRGGFVILVSAISAGKMRNVRKSGSRYGLNAG